MATMVTFHAHPDDESIMCGGVMRAAADAGHRVVLVVATRGEHGETPPGLLAPGETLAQRRVAETHEAARILGVARTVFLDHVDSGMADADTNSAPGAFAGADVEDAAAVLAALLREEDADVITVYDRLGGYGHPDHIAVHHVGRRAAELAGTPRVFEATTNRDEMRRLLAAAGELSDLPSPEEIEAMGVPEALLTTRVDVRAHLGAKRSAMAAHASQIPPDSFFLAMDEDTFAAAFGAEWFRRPGAPAGGPFEDDLFAR